MRAVAVVCSVVPPLLAAVASMAAPLVVEDPDGSLGRAGAPVSAPSTLTRAQAQAARGGRLVVLERGARSPALPAQFSPDAPGSRRGRIWLLMPAGSAGRRAFNLRTVAAGRIDALTAAADPASGQIVVRQGVQPALQYNYRTVEPGDLTGKVDPANRIYTRARSDYIHPLYGPDGEELTRDWPMEHPHHRGIYWAWPEVDWHGERGDLHALQRVFARPTGTVVLTGGPVFAQIEAENRWLWDDKTPIVREVATIRAYRGGPGGRIVDLRFELTALGEDVLLARRGAAHYGGLNMRLAPIENQQIGWHTDAPGADPRMAWETIGGRFGPARRLLAVSVFQHPANPEYPGDWVKYPELNWSQPTFPTAGTRYTLRRGRPLVLQFRVWVTAGDLPAEDACAAMWKAYRTGASSGGG